MCIIFPASFAAIALLAHCQTVRAAIYNQTVHTQYGDIYDYPAFNSTPAGNLTNWKAITVWKGIPFAADTSGNNRWKAPQPASPWNSTLYAKDYGDVCPPASTDSYSTSENCLNLNIWSAANSTDAKLPVVMWNYPAGGSARDARFDNAGMADAGVVFLNYKYRIDSLGCLAHPELSEERKSATGHNSSGNWGMLDQFAALKWVHENIAAFRGDPEHIVVQGQSAGSAATYHILNSPLTKGLIKGAIIENGVRDPRDPLCASLAENYATLEANLAQGVKFLASLNVSTIAEARQLPYTSVVGSSPLPMMSDSFFSWSATLDYYAIPDTYFNALLHGAANDVPILTGHTKDECGATYGLNISLPTYLSDLDSTFNSTWAQKFLHAYPANDSATASAAYNSQWTDRSKIGTCLWSRLWSQSSSQPVYTYFWDHAPPGQDRGAYHESEIISVLNNLYGTDLPWEEDDYVIAEKMNGYWVNFGRSGDPKGVGLEEWREVEEEAVVQRVWGWV